MKLLWWSLVAVVLGALVGLLADPDDPRRS